ncbi:MAG: phosphatidylglycerophosphatase A [Gammaproteobacteria bacterium]|tara:strand:- start:542 stop:1042 length:501 start_codon:yes stop_codon:yes gene_type:complete
MKKFPILKNPSHLFATLFGIGLLPVAPGTWGSLFGLILFLYTGVYLSISQKLFYFLLLCIISLSFIICYFATKGLDKNEKDQKSIVIDELAGVWLAFTPVAGVIMMKEFLIYSFLAFVLFRIFDIWKPYPINIVDRRIKNYFGVVLDDLIAGVYAAITMILISYLF